jgi:predicted  nucleic acid-binding Zn-ribbon protein
MRTFEAGTLAGAGSFKCEECGYAVALHERDAVPACPSCGGDRFRRAALFGEAESGATPVAESDAEAWLDEARESLVADGDYLAVDTGKRVQVIPLQDGWTRVGRSLSAHVRLDDPTVSRRHALFYRDEDGAKVLDDRSLNGVFHNGKRVELSALEDGDTVAVGRFTLHFISLSGRGAGAHTNGPAEGALA